MVAEVGSRHEQWVVAENDFGGPMVEHVHPGGPAVAYVLFGRTGQEFAQCSACGERKTLAEHQDEGRAIHS